MRHIRKLAKKIGFILGVTTITVLSACGRFESDDSNTGTQRVPLSALALVQPQSCSTYKDYVTSSLIKRYTTIPRYNYYGCGSGQGDPVLVGAPEASAGSGDVAGDTATRSGPDDVSQTNNQESGVNESDMVKVDSNTGTVFIAHSKYLLIADAYPPQNMSLVKQIDMKSQVVDLLYDEANTRLTVVTRYQDPIIYVDNGDTLTGAPVVAIDGIIAPIPNPIAPETILTFFDVAATIATGPITTPNAPIVPPADPVLIKQISIDGIYQTSRRIENRVHMVTRNQLNPDVLTSDTEFQQLNGAFYNAIANASCDSAGGTVDLDAIENDPGVIEAKANLTAKIINVVSPLDVATFLPQARLNTAAGQMDLPEYLQCNDVYHPKVKSELGMQVVTSVDSDGNNLGASGIMNNSWLTYVSKESLYIAENSNHWWWDQGNYVDQTAIHKFSISAQRPEYRATGEVDGHANNSFHFSEHSGFLRVATTQTDISPATPDSPWQRQLKNHLNILEDDETGNLNIVGSVPVYAIDESIRSVRFMGDRGFVVTFRSVDPLFAFDLSEPTKPINKGELKIPGFSTYMHPYDDTHLLTIGRDGGANGVGTGNDFQLQLIDVSDMTNPVVVSGSQYTPNLPQGYSWSAAAYDHHAFTFYKPANMLIIPVQISTYDGTQPFSGMVAFNVSLQTGITEIDRVDHADLAKKYYCDANVLSPNYQWACDNSNYIYWASPRRSIVMTEGSNIYMYTISEMGMKAGLITDSYTPISDMLFPPQVYPLYEVGIVDSNTGTGGVAVR